MLGICLLLGTMVLCMDKRCTLIENRGVEFMRTTKTSVNKRQFSLHALTRPAFKPKQFQINIVNQTHLLGLSEVTRVLLVRGSGEIEYAERAIPNKRYTK